MKDHYTIGEIGKLFHIGPDSLRYYEKLGILSPRRGDILLALTIFEC